MHRPLRIALVVNPFRFRLKAPHHAPDLARELLGRGHVVRGFGAAPGMVPRSGSDIPVPKGRGESIGGMERFVPDVLLAYDALSPAAARAARCSSRLGVPLVLVEEGLPDQGTLWERALRWIGERLWGRYVRRRADRVIALDEVARAQSLAEGFASDRVCVLPGGVDLERYRPGLTSHLPGQHGIRGRILLHLGRIDASEEMTVLVDAFARTVKGSDDWALVLAGAGPGAHKIRAQASRLGVGARLHWIGTPRSEELPGLLASATLLVAPTMGSDVAGWRARRALACGLPILAGPGPRAEELVEDDGCGLLVPRSDLESWSEALTVAAGSPQRRQRWRARARELAEERFSWREIAEDFEGILLSVLRSGDEAPDPDPDSSPGPGEPVAGTPS